MKKSTQAVSVIGITAFLVATLWLLRIHTALPDITTILHWPSWLESAAVITAHITSPAALVCVALVGTFLAVETHHVYAWLQTATTLLVTMAICWLLKEITQLPRPTESGLVASSLSAYAFPSTHAASAAVLAVLGTYHARRLTKISNTLIYTLAGLSVFVIGFSRIILAVHTLEDVLAGIALGIGIGLLAVTLWFRWHQLLSHLSEYQQRTE